jgi:hypothetical protein
MQRKTGEFSPNNSFGISKKGPKNGRAEICRQL